MKGVGFEFAIFLTQTVEDSASIDKDKEIEGYVLKKKVYSINPRGLLSNLLLDDSLRKIQQLKSLQPHR
jgi:hypothetical protein